MKTFLTLIVASFVGIASIQSSKAIPYVNLVYNGSFENFTGDWNSFGWGWTVNLALAAGMQDAADGRDYCDIYGTLFQTISTVPGTEYDFRFAVSGNFNISQSQMLNVLWGGTAVGTVTWSPDGHGIYNQGWVWADFHVLATTPTTVIKFQNPYAGDGSYRTPSIDAISVSAVPDTSAYLTPTFALVVFGLFWAKKRNHRQAG
jgi:hypothetical protein